MLTALPLQDVELLYVPVIAVFFFLFLQEYFDNCICVCMCVCVCVHAFYVRVEGRVEGKICTCV